MLVQIEADFDWVSDQDVEMDITPLPRAQSYMIHCTATAWVFRQCGCACDTLHCRCFIENASRSELEQTLNEVIRL